MKLKKVTYAGHSAVFIESDGFTVAIDPWLMGNPLCPPELQNPKRLDLILLTHGHSDHAGDAARLAKHYGARIAATFELAMIMVGEGVPQANVIPMNKGGEVEISGLRIALTNAFHSSSYDTANGPVYAGEPCGVVVMDGTHSIYHAGDTCLFSDMSLIAELYEPTLAFLPIGDRFTMGPEQASKAVELLGVRQAIPIHYRTFPPLTGTAKQFEDACRGIDAEVIILDPGKSHLLED